MNILVTGGTGFVGRHLVDRLAASGHRVVSYNRDFTARACSAVGPGADISIGPGHIAGWDRQGIFDITAAARDLGYRPGRDFRDGLAEYVDWLRDRLG